MFLSFPGYFVRRTMGPSPDILGFCRTFYIRRKRKLLRWTFFPVRILILLCWRISCTLAIYDAKIRPLLYISQNTSISDALFRFRNLFLNHSIFCWNRKGRSSNRDILSPCEMYKSGLILESYIADNLKAKRMFKIYVEY